MSERLRVWHVLSDVRCLFNWCEDAGLVERSAFPRRVMPRLQERVPDRLTDADAARELDGPARLKIFDASGRKVYERSVAFSAGETHLSWDRRTSSGAVVAPGIYMAVFEVRGIVSHARVTVLD